MTINAFSMGPWATGTNMPHALGRLGLIRSTGPRRRGVPYLGLGC
ncbi:MAG TPA: hypothetical protein VN597_15760 [Streptosporangiaceae bacterium]|nr:hypothetical protein [Streptosporangiaceae bacterium]